MASATIPFDIIIDILSRLPSKPLIRFKSVSKQWYSLITSPNFINLHLSQTLISQNSPNLIIAQYSISSVTISDENNPNFHLIELDNPLQHLCQTHNFSSYDRKFAPIILGSINGVVCISMSDKSSVVLYNPWTNTHRFIPPFTPSPNTNPHFAINREGRTINDVLFGFGFDSVSGDYKLLRMIETFKFDGLVVYREASVYSLRNDSWKCVNDQTMVDEFVLLDAAGVLVNESLHFLGMDSNSKPKIKCFNLLTEIFSIFDPPKCDESFGGQSYFIKELGGCFTVLVNYKHWMVDNWRLARVDLWVMKDYGNKESWFRLFSICDPARLEVLSYIRPVVYSRDKERVLLELDSLSFGWYSWGSKSFERITLDGLPSCDRTFVTWTLLDSLVSVGNDKDKLKAKVVPTKNKIKYETTRILSCLDLS